MQKFRIRKVDTSHVGWYVKINSAQKSSGIRLLNWYPSCYGHTNDSKEETIQNIKHEIQFNYGKTH